MATQTKVENKVELGDVRSYWSKNNIPQIWYSIKTPLTLQFFNELRRKRYRLYYEYLHDDAEFEWHRGEKVLEIGCGAGTDIAEFALNGAHVSAIDLGADQVEMTKLNFKLRKLPIDFLETGNAEQLQFEDKSFDVVYSFGVLHHTPNTEKAISEVHRVLRDDGTGIIMLYARGWKHYIKRCFITGLLKGRWIANKLNWQKVYNEASEVNGNAPKTGVYTKRQVKKMFSEFETVSIEKRRMGEFFDYKPYDTVKFPSFIKMIADFFNMQAWFGENWIIKVQKKGSLKKGKVSQVIFKHY